MAHDDKDNSNLSYAEHFFQQGKGHIGSVGVLMESREEEPVWQRCNVATDNRNWNDTSNTHHFLVPVKPGQDVACFQKGLVTWH